MKSIDFTKTGGFPLTQDQLAYLQTAWTEVLNALASATGISTNTPVAVSGMAVTVAGGNITVTDGWFFYKSQLIRFSGSTVTPGGTDVAMVLITATANPLTFKDGSTPNVVLESTGSLITGASTTDATHFPVTSIVPWVVRDSVVYEQLTIIEGYITTLQGQMSTLSPYLNAWSNYAAPTFTAVGGGSTTQTVTYSKYMLVGKTLTWQLRLTAVAISGVVNEIRVQGPVGNAWANIDMRFVGFTNNGGSYVVQGRLRTDGSGNPIVALTYENEDSAFPVASGVEIDLHLCAEVV